MSAEALRPLLVQGATELGVDLDPTMVTSLLAYITELARWNQAYNLTGVRDPADMVPTHLLDSLTLLPWLEGRRVLDLGSGAGLPGIPLAIVRPGLEITLLDSSLKRTRFLENALRMLDLSNVRVVRARAEDWRPEPPFHTVVARAVGTAGELSRLAADLVAEGGRLILMKGGDPGAELADLDPVFDIEAVPTVYVPQLTRERSLVVLRRRGAADTD